MAAFKVFAFDYATAGGPMGRALPHSLRCQGAMLLQALLADLGALPDVEGAVRSTRGPPPRYRISNREGGDR